MDTAAPFINAVSAATAALEHLVASEGRWPEQGRPAVEDLAEQLQWHSQNYTQPSPGNFNSQIPVGIMNLLNRAWEPATVRDMHTILAHHAESLRLLARGELDQCDWPALFEQIVHLKMAAERVLVAA